MRNKKAYSKKREHFFLIVWKRMLSNNLMGFLNWEQTGNKLGTNREQPGTERNILKVDFPRFCSHLFPVVPIMCSLLIDVDNGPYADLFPVFPLFFKTFLSGKSFAKGGRQ